MIVDGPLQDLVHHALRHESREDTAQALALELVEAYLREARADTWTKQHRIERLWQVVIRADLDATDDALGLVDARDHDHRNILQRGVALYVLQYRDAVELRHDNVEQDDVVRVVVEQL